ncbi:PKHD-type hydroxylase [Tistlia consotensis]|uniref:PKHD-type hydroxylase n=1 Tax=Tistlia consotensis USBA 355 TaxID=560819 RepID=A0A1Y6CAL2_9PROT|nr:Fe2+-dependent dioxygenase [Tistlia consotensis]SMF54386.1 PKHD-type hydroxylase [Tistlia consotensis USBA 355]SNR86898.1 PKHD-type hydroxylase [Tistlia consotensis]
MIIRIPDMLQRHEAEVLRGLLLNGAFEDGRTTASGQAALIKNNLQLARGSEARKQADQIVRDAVARSQKLRDKTLVKMVAPPTYNRYDIGMEYGDHVDAPSLNDGRFRADLSMTIFLTDPADYDGGDLVMNHGDVETRIKYGVGEAVVYPTTVRHHVAPVTRGSRLAAVTWLQSYIGDPLQRQILVDLSDAKNQLEARQPDAPELTTLKNALFNLLRAWWQP